MNNTNQNLIEILKQSGLGEDEKKKLIQTMNAMISDRILLAITKNLGDAAAKEVEAKLNQNVEPAEIMNYIKEKLPNLEEIIKEEINQVELKILAFLQEK